jgi:hypothetical protein
MSNTLFEKKLALSKAQESPEVVLLVADDPQMLRIVIAWTSLAVTRAEPLSELTQDAEDAVWRWLWENARYSETDLRAQSGASSFGFHQDLEQLIGNRIIYPDGTINTYVQRYLREKVLGLFGTKPKKRAAKASAK